MYPKFKRLFDVLLALTAFFVFCPILLIVMLLIKLTSPGSVFYSQERLGKDGKVFKLYKFRSMTDIKRDEYVQVSSNNSEVTLIGKII